MRQIFPWILCGVLGVAVAAQYVQVQKLRAAKDAANAENRAEAGLAGGLAEASPVPQVSTSPNLSEWSGGGDELLKLRSEVGMLRAAKQELEAKAKAAEELRQTNQVLQERLSLQAAQVAVVNHALEQRDGALPPARNDQPPPKLGMIGAMLQPSNGFPIVYWVGTDSPAQRAGLKEGDIVVGINGTNTSQMTFAQVMQAIRGDEGTQVILDIDDGGGAARRVNLVRQKIDPGTVRRNAPQ